jgi:hypothetical protein
MRIFLSYGHDANEELVRTIKAGLEARGHDVWFDKSEIKAGDNWRREITDGITNSHRVLSFLSKHSMRDPGVCRDEVAIAIGVKGGNIQTVLVEGELDVEPPVDISHIQWLDMHDWKERRAQGADAWSDWYEAKFAEIVRVVESDQSRRFAGEIERLSDRLKPIRSDSRVYELLKKGYFGRAWLFDAVDEWMRAKDASRLLWITGEAGVGKSAFAAQLVHTRPDVIAAQFVEWDKPDHRSPRRVICNIAFQLATRLPDYRKLLLTLPEIDRLDRKDADELFDYLLAGPLRTVIGGGHQQHLIVIDALDEAGDSTRNPLVELLARDASRLPEWLGLVITSRPESSIVAPLQGLHPLVLDTRNDANRNDLRDYLWARLGPQLQSRPDRDLIIEKILERSDGLFLYVERFCEIVRNDQIALDRPEEFPRGLGGIFHQFLQRQLPDVGEFRRTFRPPLRAILAAREPLPLDILQGVVGWQREELRDFTHALGSLFPVSTVGGREVITPYHKSLADWLTDESRAGIYYVDKIDGHRQLAQDCMNALAQRESDDGAVKGMAGDDYRARNLLHHLIESKNWDRLVECISDPHIFDNLWPPSYGHVDGEQLLTYSGQEPDVDILTPRALDRLSEEHRSTVPWELAKAFATQADRLMSRAFKFASDHGEGTNTMKSYFEGLPWEQRKQEGSLDYSRLVYAFAYLSRLPAEFAMSPCQFEPVRIAGGQFDGRVVLRARDQDFSAKARNLMQEAKAVRLYVRYLGNFAASEGWSMQLQQMIAEDSDAAWQKLAPLAYGKNNQLPGFVPAPAQEAFRFSAPWGGFMHKPAGWDALLARDIDVDGTEQNYVVFVGPDGNPDGWQLSAPSASDQR